jgi:MFS transporter, FHS family, L-fucose permease
MATRSTPAAAQSSSYVGPFIIVSFLFFVFGFLTTLNTFLEPLVESAFGLNQFWANAVNGAFFVAYLLFSAPTAKLIEGIGYKRTMVVSLVVMAAGTLLFIPSAGALLYPLFLTAILVLAAGIAALQTSANPYISVLGPEHSAPARLTLAQAFNSIGATISGHVAGKFILAKALDPDQLARLSNEARHAYQVQTASAVRAPYLFFAIALIILALAVALAKLPTLQITREFRPAKDSDGALKTSIWSYKHTVLGAFGIFLYVGVEVGLGSNLTDYLARPDVGAIPRAEAAEMVGYFYWGGALIGRLLGSWILTKITAPKLLGLFGCLAAVSVAISMFTTGSVAEWSVLLAGFFNSIMFPNIFALGVKGLGPLTSKGSGLIMSGVVGGAVIPMILGQIIVWGRATGVGDTAAIQHAFLLPIVCYLFIAYYGVWGSKPVRTVMA